MRRAAGFTLIELMITIAVVGILLVIGVPTMRGVDRERTHPCGRRVVEIRP